jgi:hypothetical protein
MAVTTPSTKGVGVTLVDLETGASRRLIKDEWPPVDVLAWTPRP